KKERRITLKINVENISKTFGKKHALDNVSFTLNEHKIYGLLGRNGAGKTTFMDILAGHQLPSKGNITVNGKNPFDERDILKHICLIKEGDNFQKDMTVKQILKAYRYFYPNWDQDLANELVKEYQLPVNKRLKTFSKGMLSAVGVIVGLASKATITIFDEPYIGLDAAARKRFYDILLEEFELEPRTVIFSTHLIDEVSLLFEEVLILQDGKLILQEETEKLRNEACAVTGEVDVVKDFIIDKQVIKTKQLANMMTAYIYGNKQEAEKSYLQVEGIPIQDLMIYLTEKQEVQIG